MSAWSLLRTEEQDYKEQQAPQAAPEDEVTSTFTHNPQLQDTGWERNEQWPFWERQNTGREVWGGGGGGGNNTTKEKGKRERYRQTKVRAFIKSHQIVFLSYQPASKPSAI